MSTDPVAVALRAALAAQAGAALRMTVGKWLRELGQPAQGLAELERALGLDAADSATLAVAAQAAESVGDSRQQPERCGSQHSCVICSGNTE